MSSTIGNAMIKDPIEEYRTLRLRIDGEIEKLVRIHSSDITCHPGCAVCCINLTVFPVEFFAILEDLKKSSVRQGDFCFDTSAPCGFLDEKGLCRIYHFRPIICRTHGLPILFLNDSQEDPAWEISYCEFNFRNKTDIEFTNDTLLDIEIINAELNRLNNTFVSSLPVRIYSADHRIPIDKLNKAFKVIKGSHGSP